MSFEHNAGAGDPSGKNFLKGSIEGQGVKLQDAVARGQIENPRRGAGVVDDRGVRHFNGFRLASASRSENQISRLRRQRQTRRGRRQSLQVLRGERHNAVRQNSEVNA